ncbi:glycoside hydrolase [uncultured Polaribacter sp.]|uniref:glycoside hydrolase n=1 Tax=uncultured Polaribacter sp. TaxID=174711 RepID=UPI0026218F5B|nr:glycoside hydrolase [uncultured Polaribacter sp.]
MLLLFSKDISSQVLKISINKNKSYQEIKGFGASDAWRCQYVGSNWPQEKKERIAELLFSKEIDKDGQPKGIGLSFWRFYIGAGTKEQGSDSNIKNEWRRAESFINADGNYDWSKQKGQQWFLQEAKSYGVDNFLAFSISAPVQWTLNGKGYGENIKSPKINLKTDKFGDYAKFMVDFLTYFKSEGIDFNYLSPINEPQWQWEKRTQEGTPATNKDILDITKLVDKHINERKLSTKIVLAEAADLRWLYSSYGKSERGNQIDYFFNNKVKVKSLDKTISGHSYFTTWPVESLISVRQDLNQKLKQYSNLEYWQSEFCILEKNDDIGGGGKRDLGMATALYVARVMHADLTLANTSSWQWWTALTNADYKDGLIYLDTGNPEDMYNLNSLKFNGNFHDSKLLWAFGNYSRFVKPRMIRVDANFNREEKLLEQYKNIMCSTYLNPKTEEYVSVVINYSNKDRKVQFNDFYVDRIYVTSNDNNLKLIKSSSTINIKAKSINTIIGHKI